MKNIASLFSDEAKKALHNELSIDLSDSHDYSEDELESLYNKISDDFPYAYSPDGEPQPTGTIFEELIDTFVKNNLIDF